MTPQPPSETRGLTATRGDRPVSSQRRVARGWAAVVIGCFALAAPLLIGDWWFLFLFAFAPMGIFIVLVGVIEIVRGIRSER